MPVSGDKIRVGFLGAGRMAAALAKGLVSADFAAADSLIASDPLPAARDAFTAQSGGRATASNVEVLKSADVVVLAVKPQHVCEVLMDVRTEVQSRHLVISIAAGVSLKTLVGLLGSSTRLVRVMPNTPSLVGLGAAGFALGGGATAADGDLVRRLLSTVGLAVELPEGLLDAVTGLSGSGPAYVYQVIEAMSDGGVLMGLPRDVATKLAAQTVAGAARMVLQTGESPAVLKDAVASPGGTTIAGLHALESGGLRAAMMNAVRAATLRSRELGESA
ncbi:MAG TPA: pyrroline-5-carboxylate reductase [Planctomycetaceae bacterium]|jgi:pyrroline-5-carboxylate reductase|nr:pyrroline-5-carboxylate reductase [Planctomycetaceae bacterium]